MLTDEQRRLRAGKLTASRVGVLVGDRPDKIYQLWLEMTGQTIEENLDDVWAVQLGTVTEELNLRWYEKKNGRLLTRRGEVVVHPKYDWAACTLDGYDEEIHCPVECKHVGGREPAELVIDRYQPQMHWTMACTTSGECAISQIRGANEPIVDYVTFDAGYSATLWERAEYFMMCVEMNRPPVRLAPVPPPIDATAVIDMTGNNRWSDYAHEWLQAKPYADRADDLNKLIKSMVPPEAKRVFGHGIRLTRSRPSAKQPNGILSLRKDEE